MRSFVRRALVASLYASGSALVLSAGVSAAHAQASQQAQSHNFDIAAQSLGTALNEVSRQSGQVIMADANVINGRRAPAVRGTMTVEQALAILLRGTGLVATKNSSGGYAIVRDTRSQVAVTSGSERPVADPAPNPIVVTGTRIPGAEPTSQTVVITREDIEARGYTSAEEALRSLPQFLGTFGENATTLGGNDNNAILTSNTAGQSAANLRGLGASNVLVLVNGRRTSASSALGLFGGDITLNATNLATIPFAAVERIEVILDGASALYGSDAVGGVINFILRDDFSGGELSAYYEDGKAGGRELRISGVFGQTWSGGNLTVSGEYANRAPVSSAGIGYTTNNYAELFDNPFAVDQRYRGEPLRIESPFEGYFDPQGGSQILNQDDVDGISGRIVDESAGTDPGPRVDQIEPELLPERERFTIRFAGEQELFTNFTLNAGVTYTSNETIRTRRPTTREVRFPRVFVDAGTPFNSSDTDLRLRGFIPFGISDLLPDVIITNKSDRRSIYGGFEYDLSDAIGPNWLVAVDYNNDVSNEKFSALNGAFFDAEVFETLVNDGSVNPFISLADQPAMAQAFQEDDFFGGRGASSESFVDQFQFSARGSLFELPGGLAGIAFGGELRRDGYNLDESLLRGGSAGSFTATFNVVDPETNLKAVYAELNLPVFDALEVSLSGRYDHYSATGESETLGSIDNTYEAFSPRIGAAFYPFPSLKLRGNWQESLRAPTLSQLFVAPQTVRPFFPPVTDYLHPSGNPQRPPFFSVLQTTRGNPDLAAERSESWSLGADWDVDFVPGLRLSVNYNNTKIDDAFAYTFDIFRSEAAFVAGGPSAFGLVVRGDDGLIDEVFLQPINIASVSSESLDFFAEYSQDFDFGRIEFIFNGTRTLTNERVIVESADGILIDDNLGQITGPSKWNHFAQLGWSDGPARVNVIMNFVGGFTNSGYDLFLRNGSRADPYLGNQLQPLATPFEEIPGATRDDIIQEVGSFTTFDLFGQYRFEDMGVRVTAGIENLFDTRPPYVFTQRSVPFSSGRHDPLGRRFSLSVTKEF